MKVITIVVEPPVEHEQGLTQGTSVVTHDVDKDRLLRFMQDTVEGYVETVWCDKHSAILWCNDNVDRETVPPNFAATALVMDTGVRIAGAIHGNVVLTGPPGNEGDTQGLTKAQVEAITTEVMGRQPGVFN